MTVNLPETTEQASSAAPIGTSSRVGSAAGSLAVTGGRRLTGNVTVGPSVSAAQILLAAAALQTRSVTLQRVPQSAHIAQMIDLVALSGCGIKAGGPGEVTIVGHRPPEAADRELPIPGPRLFAAFEHTDTALHLIPAMLRAFGCALLPWSDTHVIDEVLAVYKKFGDTIETGTSGFAIAAAEKNTEEIEIEMRTRALEPTAAAILRACTARSRAVIMRPSRRPEIRALLEALTGLGWRVHSNEARLELEPAPNTARPLLTWTVPGDEVEAAAYICALLATGGYGKVRGLDTQDLTVLRMLLAQSGARLELSGGRQATVLASRKHPLTGWKGLTAAAGHEPRELPSEQFALLAAAAPSIGGDHRLTDHVVEHRIDSVAAQLRAGGVPIPTSGEPGHLELTGRCSLAAPTSTLEPGDATAATAMVIAALAARGTTLIDALELLRNAHPMLITNLLLLGADLHEGVAK